MTAAILPWCGEAVRCRNGGLCWEPGGWRKPQDETRQEEASADSAPETTAPRWPRRAPTLMPHARCSQGKPQQLTHTALYLESRPPAGFPWLHSNVHKDSHWPRSHEGAAWSWSPPKSEDILPPSESQALAKLAQHGRRSVRPPQSLWVPTGGWNQHLSARLYSCLSKHPFIHPLSIPPFTTCPLAVHRPSLHLSVDSSTHHLSTCVLPLPSTGGPCSMLGPSPGTGACPLLTLQQPRPHSLGEPQAVVGERWKVRHPHPQGAGHRHRREGHGTAVKSESDRHTIPHLTRA